MSYPSHSHKAAVTAGEPRCPLHRGGGNHTPPPPATPSGLLAHSSSSRDSCLQTLERGTRGVGADHGWFSSAVSSTARGQ